IEFEAFVVHEFRAALPHNTDLRPPDEIISKGRVYTVQGSPWETVVPRSRIGVLNANLKYVGPVTP
uniref:hypothetical protein n=1 Tax=Salmonella enterica TaxID=28901 RepID=UPI00329757BE